MNSVYAITRNTEISYGETFSFLRYTIYILENTILHVIQPKEEGEERQRDEAL
jgi:hypothetical protein